MTKRANKRGGEARELYRGKEDLLVGIIPWGPGFGSRPLGPCPAWTREEGEGKGKETLTSGPRVSARETAGSGCQWKEE
jgi:hypothetical protein